MGCEENFVSWINLVTGREIQPLVLVARAFVLNTMLVPTPQNHKSKDVAIHSKSEHKINKTFEKSTILGTCL